MTESLIPRLCFSKTKTHFQRKGGRRATRTCLSSTLSLSLWPRILCIFRTTHDASKLPTETLGIKWSFVFSVTRTSPPLSGLGCSADTAISNPWECPSRPGGLDLFLETLIAGLDPRPSDWWPFRTLVICWNPEHPPSLVSLPHPSLSGIMVLLLI